uniref:Uncharacterized protein n=1 Tax=Leersia perrieri TaxID=77586 RepID=A0A0D9W250_9ORYZ
MKSAWYIAAVSVSQETGGMWSGTGRGMAVVRGSSRRRSWQTSMADGRGKDGEGALDGFCQEEG